MPHANVILKEMPKTLKKLAKQAKFRQIWSHWSTTYIDCEEKNSMNEVEHIKE